MAEQYANDAQTTLAGAITSSATSLTVSSTVGFPTSGNFRIRIDGELLLVTAVSGTTWTVMRAVEPVGGVQTATAHSAGATVTHVLTAASVQLVLPGDVAYVDVAQTFTAQQTFDAGASSPGSGSNSEQWGASASTGTAHNAVAVGQGASASCNYGTAIGQAASVSGSGQATAIGQGASASGVNALAIGSDASVSADNAIAIGGGATVTTRGIALGDVTVGNNGVAVGLNASTIRNGDLVFFWDQGNNSTSGFLLQCKTSTNTLRNFFYLGSTFVSSTDASYTCRTTLNVYDYAALREGIRIESDGTEARLGFFGTTATVQPSTTAGHGATAGSTYTSNEQKMLNDVFAALEKLGLMA